MLDGLETSASNASLNEPPWYGFQRGASCCAGCPRFPMRLQAQNEQGTQWEAGICSLGSSWMGWRLVQGTKASTLYLHEICVGFAWNLRGICMAFMSKLCMNKSTVGGWNRFLGWCWMGWRLLQATHPSTSPLVRLPKGGKLLCWLPPLSNEVTSSK